MRRFAAILLSLLLAVPCTAQTKGARQPVTGEAAPAPAAPDSPAPAYEPKLLELSEILGALSFLTELCREGATAQGADAWRAKMVDLMDAEASTPGQKERMAGAFNHGLSGYQASYRVCTESGRMAIERLKVDGARLAHELANRYGS